MQSAPSPGGESRSGGQSRQRGQGSGAGRAGRRRAIIVSGVLMLAIASRSPPICHDDGTRPPSGVITCL